MTEHERLEELMKRLDRATAEAFAVYISTMRSDETIREVERLLRLNRINEAIDLVDSHIRKFASVIPRNYALVGNSTAASIEPTIRPRIAISFDPAHPRAAAQMRQQSLELIREIGTSQRESIRNALTESFAAGDGPRQSARAYRDAVGLTEKQRQAVKNYRTLLETGNTEAFSRGLRDARFGPKDTSAAARSAYLDTLDQSQIDRMVEAYERKYLNYRAETIAQTETTRTLNEANEEAFAQTMEQAGLNDDWIERTWVSTKDKRTRDTHAQMIRRVVIGTQTPFITGGGFQMIRPGAEGAPASEVIRCRCTVIHRIRTAEEVAAGVS